MDDKAIGAKVRGLLPGQKLFNRYTLTRLLGRGETGVVWLARDGHEDRDAALKFLPEVIATDRSALVGMRRKARHAIDLAHPNIARIHDFLSDGQLAAFSVEFLAGKPLAAVRAGEPTKVISPDKLGPWIIQICGALDYAHNKVQVVHRDIKPVNLLLDTDNNVKVSDFGIAATLSDEDAWIFKEGSSTSALSYMSPQQLNGEPPAVTDDIYSLGVTLYELLTSKPPFYEGDVLDKMEKEVPPSIAKRRVELGITDMSPVPPEWEETIAACLAKYASARPQIMSRVVERMGLSEGTPSEAVEIGAVDESARTKPKDADLITRLTNSPFQSLTNSPFAENIAEEVHKITKSRGFKLRAILYPSIIAACVVLTAAGYLFGIYLPEKKQRAIKAAADAISWAKTKAENTYSVSMVAAPGDDLSKRVIRGRKFQTKDFYTNALPVALMSEEAWTMAWGRDPIVMGREITPVGMAPHMIVGVVLASDDQSLNHDLFLPDRTLKNPKKAKWVLLAHKAEGEAREGGKLGATGLYRAVKADDLEKVTTYLNAGVEPDNVNDDPTYLGTRVTPLTAAAMFGRFEIAKALLDAGADVNQRHEQGITPLGIALRERQIAIVKLLLERGADLSKDVLSAMPLSLAIQTGDVELIELLLEAGADPNLGNPESNALPPIISAFSLGDRNLIERLVKAGGRLDLTFQHKKWQQPYTSLMAAAESGNLEFFEWVRSIGGQPGPLSGDAWTMAHTAAQGGGLEILTAVVAQGADINANHSDSGTPLHVAARNNHKEAVRWLLNEGADASIRDQDGFTPLEVAEQVGATNVVSAIRQFLDSRPVRSVAAQNITEPVEAPIVADVAPPVVEEQPAPIVTPQEHIPAPVSGQTWTLPVLNLVIQPVSPGNFTMGRAARGSSNERPFTQVNLTKPFWLGATEVTQAQWKEIMGTTIQDQRQKINGVWPARGEGDNHPMYFVTWDEAVEFCRKLTEREQAAERLPEGYAYTLPTEAQWEYACRAGETDDFQSNPDEMGWYAANSVGQSHPVGQKQANAWGLYDMHGNVLEWCLDLYGLYPGGEVTDPTGATSGSLNIARGGDWTSSVSRSSSSSRNKKASDSRYNFLGFRIALTPIR